MFLRVRWCINVFTSPPDLSIVFFSFVFVVVCLVLLSLVAAAFLVNKDVYINAWAIVLAASIVIDRAELSQLKVT